MLWIALLLVWGWGCRAAAQELIFADTVLNIGAVTDTDAPHTYRFRFVNRSKRPAVILRIDSSCGCVKPSFSRRPVPAGGSGEVLLTFDPRGQAGAIYKLLPLYTAASGARPAVRLALSGTVRRSEKPKPKSSPAPKSDAPAQ